MPAPSEILARLPEALRQNGLVSLGGRSAGSLGPARARALEPAPEESAEARWSAALLEGSLPRGCVTELALAGGLAGGTSLALRACRHAQAEEPGLWVAFVDPTRTLHAPGVDRAGVELSRLLVVRPPLAGLRRGALRLAEARLFSLVVLDLSGLPTRPLELDLVRWVPVVRRLTQSCEQSTRRVLLLTAREGRRALPLPVAHRIELEREPAGALAFQVVRSRGGALTGRGSLSLEGLPGAPGPQGTGPRGDGPRGDGQSAA
jgi:recombination protein RecA